MFIAASANEKRIPRAFAGEGDRFYMRVDLSVESAFLLLTYLVRDGATCLRQTVFLAWEMSLISFAKSVRSEDIVSIARVEPQGDGHWRLRPYTDVWLTSEEEAKTIGPILTRLRHDIVRDCRGEPADAPSASFWSRSESTMGPSDHG